MAKETVKLTEQDLNIIIEISQLVVDYKHRTLGTNSKTVFEQIFLPKLVEQIAENTWAINDVHNNTFTWLIDQIAHSRRLIPGVKAKECVLLADTPIGELALAICRAASRGQTSYDSLRRATKFGDLFDIE